jgi:hypothetical protein
MEIALSHEETWIDPTPGARIACTELSYVQRR